MLNFEAYPFVRLRRRLIFLALLILVTASDRGLADEFGTGVAAYKSGRFQIAHEIFSRLARTRDARAEFALGLLYDNGEGVDVDRELAIGWYAKSAAQGYAKGQ